MLERSVTENIFRNVKWSHGKLYGEIYSDPLRHKRTYIANLESVEVSHFENWEKEKTEWIDHVNSVLRLPIIPHNIQIEGSKKKKIHSKRKVAQPEYNYDYHKKRIRSRTCALRYWDKKLKQSIEELEGLLSKENILRIRTVTIIALKAYIKRYQSPARLKVDIYRLKKFISNPVDCKKYVICKEAKTGNKAVHVGRSAICQSHPMFLLPSDLNSTEMMLSRANQALEHALIKQRHSSHILVILRNYITAVEKQIFEFLCRNTSAEKLKEFGKDYYLSIVLDLFAGHGIETVTDVDSWKRNYNNQRTYARNNHRKCSDLFFANVV